MSDGSSADILVLSNIQAKEIAGSLLALGQEVYQLKDYDPAHPGQPPWRSGAEGKAYPLLGRDGSAAAYLKFFTRPTPKRLDRTAWLIGQQMHTWLPGLVAAPLLWVDTRLSSRSAEIDFDFAGYLAPSVPGETWLELKNHMVDTGAAPPQDFRWRCVADLVLATAVLERAGIVHGDLSPNNIIINPNAPPDEPALYLIDFDAFVAPAAGANQDICVAEGGTFGTEGYCPADLGVGAARGDSSVAPYSDRYGRDMLILELLLMHPLLSPDDPPAKWNPVVLERLLGAWRAACDPARRQTLAHLDVPAVFSLPESARPTSMQLAEGLGLELPESPTLCTDEQLSAAIPGFRSVSAHVRKQRRRRPAPSRVEKQSRQAAPSSRVPTLNQWQLSAQVVPRTYRRVRRSARPPVPQDNLGTIFLTVMFMVLIWSAIFFVPMSSCEGPGGSDRPHRSEVNAPKD